MLVKDLYTIEKYLINVAKNLKNFVSTRFSTVNFDTDDDDAISFYFVKQVNSSDNLIKDNHIAYNNFQYKKSKCYYDCKRNTFIDTIDNEYYLIKNINEFFKIIINNKDSEKFHFVLKEGLFKYIVTYCREKINEALLNASNKNPDIVDLFRSQVFQFFYNKIFENINFYIELSDCDKIQDLNNDYSLNLGFSVAFTTGQLNDSEMELVKNGLKMLEDQTRKFFKDKLYVTKFLFIDHNYYERDDGKLWHLAYFVFQFPNLEQILFIRILEELFFFLEFYYED